MWDILAEVSWQEMAGTVVAAIATWTGAVVANDRRKARRQRVSDSADRDHAAVVLQGECDRRHKDLQTLLESQQLNINERFKELKSDLNAGFTRLENSMSRRQNA